METLFGFLLVSFLAGVLTVLAPCVLPIVPVILGGSITSQSKARPYIVVGSLFASIILFSLVIKASTVLIGVPTAFWNYLSGGIVVIFGVTLLFPNLWEKIQSKAKLYDKANRMMGKGYKKGGFWGAVVVGAALGPVFSSCSPVFLLILSVVLPANFAMGLLFIVSYAFGLCLVLLLVGKFGQVVIDKFKWLADPNGLFKRGLGLFLVLVGFAVLMGLDRTLQAWLIANGLYTPSF